MKRVRSFFDIFPFSSFATEANRIILILYDPFGIQKILPGMKITLKNA